MLGTEQLFGSIDCQLFYHVYELAPTVVTPPWIALRILVRQHTPNSLHNRRTCVILTCNHLKPLLLAKCFRFDRRPNGWILRLKYAHKYD